MMLRESSKLEGRSVDLQVVTSGADPNGDLPAEEELIAFAEAALDGDTAAITAARSALVDRLGSRAMIDAAGVISNFQRMVRIADGTGIPLDEPIAMITARMREDLGLNDYSSAEYTPPIGFFKRCLGIVLGKMIPFAFRRMRSKVDG